MDPRRRMPMSTSIKQAKGGALKLVRGPRGHPTNVVDSDASSSETV
jgi:hypothetical protein